MAIGSQSAESIKLAVAAATPRLRTCARWSAAAT